MSELKKLGLGILAVAGGALAPTVPQDMELLYSYQYRATDVPEVAPHATSTTKTAVVHPPEFIDEDGNGLISVAVFASKDGKVQEVQLTDEKYAEMGRVGGFLKNPKRSELVSLIEALQPQKVEAAIAYDNSTAGTVASATSLTYAHTVAGSNRFLVSAFVKHGTCDISYTHSMTYNGTSMTLLGSGTYPACSAVAIMHTYYLAAPATGTNNVVVTTSGSNQTIYSVVGSYTGVDQSAPLDNSAVYNPGSQANTITTSLTVNTDGAWILSLPLSFNTNNTEMTAQGVLTQRRACNTDGVCLGDTNGTQTTGSKSVSWDKSVAGNNLSTMTNISLEPAVDAVPSVQVIFFQ